MKPKTTKLLQLIAMAAVAGGGHVLYQHFDANQADLARASMDWRSVPGLVTRSNLESRRNRIGARKTADFDVEVDYEYVVGETVYRNDVVRFDQGQLSTGEKKRLVGTYPPGRRIEVFYDPENPGRSVLVRGSYEQTNR